jgi:hypothetical protein
MRMIGIRQAGRCGGAVLGLLLSACNSFDAPPGPESTEPRLVIPLDERAAVGQATAPPAISGGTLSVTADGSAAIVSDPDRDRVSIVDLSSLAVRYTVNLDPGSEPGRSVEDGNKHIHVVLRRGGGVVAIDPASGAVLDRRAVCKSPRGIAFEPTTKLLHVACAEGKLVSLPAEGGAAVRTVALDPDLRDVIVRGSELWVTRFKSAEVLRISSAGVLGQRMIIPQTQGMLSQPAPADGSGIPSSKSVAVLPGVAWRAVPSASGGVVVVHQQAVVDDIDITAPSTQGSAYGGGGFDCSGIVKDAVSFIAADGSVTSAPFSGAPLPVDVAVSPDQSWVAVAHAGPADPSARRPFLVFPNSGSESVGDVAPPSAIGSGTSVTILPVPSLGSGGDCNFSQTASFSDPVTAVAFTPNGSLLAQTREPPQLLLLRSTDMPFGQPVIVALPGESRLDTGHELFHRDAGGGIACASCHPEGGEDGRTWHFTDTGARRTQALHVGLRDTAPFHWNGDLPDVGALMSEVFVGRMGGVREASARIDTLSNWLFALTPPPAIRDAADESAVRGKALFDSAAVGCTSCHSGAKFTNNQSLAIDTLTAKKLQVPSLIAVGYRAPFMHTGCAATLTRRFDPACGGDAHGNTSTLNATQLSDLVAYLESL